jgi:hypothetical protein
MNGLVVFTGALKSHQGHLPHSAVTGGMILALVHTLELFFELAVGIPQMNGIINGELRNNPTVAQPIG